MTRVSLILTTYHRQEAVRGFLESLIAQDTHGVELIVIDQNDDHSLEAVTDGLEGPTIRYKHVGKRMGISEARNMGLCEITGELVGFPDDDCRYPDGLIAYVRSVMDASAQLGGVSGRVSTFTGDAYGRFDPRPGIMNRSNAWQRASAVSLFLRRGVVRAVGGFDETLGPGSGTQWGGGEDIDYPLRAIEMGVKILYDPKIEIFHPAPSRQGDEAFRNRAYRYGLGIGRVWRKHQFPFWRVATYLVRPLAGAVAFLLLGRPTRARTHWAALKGRLGGWIPRYP